MNVFKTFICRENILVIPLSSALQSIYKYCMSYLYKLLCSQSKHVFSYLNIEKQGEAGKELQFTSQYKNNQSFFLPFFSNKVKEKSPDLSQKGLFSDS